MPVDSRLAAEQVEVAGGARPGALRLRGGVWAAPWRARLASEPRVLAGRHPGVRASGGGRARPQPARLARVVLRQLGEARDVALALDAHRVVGGQPLDQALDAVADLQREVRRGWAGQRADVLDGDLGRPLASRSGRSASLTLSGCAGHPARGFPCSCSGVPGGGPSPPPLPDLTGASSARSSTCGLEADRDRVLIADQPDVVVDGAGRVVRGSPGLTSSRYPRKRPGTWSGSSVTSSGPQVPLADSGAAAAASSGRRRIRRSRTRGRGR